MKRAVCLIIVIIIALLMLVLIPVDTSKENSKAVTGTIRSVREGGVKDMVLELENDPVTYYVNRGFENGFTLDRAKKDFTGQHVKLHYAKGWTPLAFRDNLQTHHTFYHERFCSV